MRVKVLRDTYYRDRDGALRELRAGETALVFSEDLPKCGANVEALETDALDEPPRDKMVKRAHVK